MKTILLFFIAFTCQAANLGDYFPQNRVSYYADSNGNMTARYGFEKHSPGLQKAFKFKKGGTIGGWDKSYFNGSYFQHIVVQPLYFGNNQSVIELGGLKNEGKVTYKIGDISTGLYWSAPGGLSYGYRTKQMDVYVNGNHGDLRAYSRTRLIEQLPSYTLEHGNRQTYQDVVHIVFYHGTKTTAHDIVRCFDKQVLNAENQPYIAMKGYNSYAVELWLARGIGVIKERQIFSEQREGERNCAGNMFDGGENWTNYLIN